MGEIVFFYHLFVLPFSASLAPLELPSYAVWKHPNTAKHSDFCGSNASGSNTAGVGPNSGTAPSGSNSFSHPPGSGSSSHHPGHAPSQHIKPGLSPISPAASLEAPKSNAGPGSVGPPSVGPPPRSVGAPPSLASPAAHKIAPTPLRGTAAPTANSLTVNLVLSDSLLNLYRNDKI